MAKDRIAELKDVLPGVVESMGVTDRAYQIVSLLEHALHRISPSATIVSFKHNRLCVELDSSVHVYEMNLRKKEILKALDCLPQAVKPEILFFLRGTARPKASERLRSTNPFAALKNKN